MHSIYKYPLVIVGEQALELPIDSKILSVASQEIEIEMGTLKELVLYALVTTNETEELQTFLIKIIGTGNPINIDSLNGYIFLNTVKQDSFMWHVYYKKEK